MKIITRFLVFAVINFSALGLGTILMGNGATSSWYQQLNKAPWTPEGWVFGAAWFTVMLCFSAYMA
ncbi:MAG: tryptophan-rich sensory protein, partial [Psychroserpens sp.]|nr:tryptophan-rich sensory protein [Psychroserpens sp.]